MVVVAIIFTMPKCKIYNKHVKEDVIVKHIESLVVDQTTTVVFCQRWIYI